MDAQQIADALCGGHAKRSGNNYVAPCPAHDDANESFGVADGEKGVIFRCYAGCDQRSVFEALKSRGLLDGDGGSFKPEARPERERTPKPKRPTRIAATYDYVDEHGELLYQSLRKEYTDAEGGKTFSQRRKGRDGDPPNRVFNGWFYSVDDCRKVLYRLPEVLAARKAVFIVEGEKCVEALRAIECTATCNVAGAGKWRPEYAEALRGRTVILLPDNDGPGERHARQVWDSLQGIAARVRVVRLPGLPPKGDIADWLDAGGTRQALAALVTAALESAPEPPEPGPPGKAQEPAAPQPAPTVAPPAAAERPATALAAPEANTPGFGRWEKLGLILNDKGTPLANLDNAVRVLERAPDLTAALWFDEFLQRVLTTWGADDGPPREWSDADDIRLALWLQRSIQIGRMAVGTAKDAVVAVAHANRRNSAREWLQAQVWDGVERLPQLLQLGFGAEPDAYTAAVGRCFMVGMVARVMDPGCKVDAMPVFEGPQGKGKSTAVQTLVGAAWYGEPTEAITSKDFLQSLQGKVLLEIAELDTFSRAEVTAVKRVITCRVDRFRAPYGRHVEDHPRQCVFAGTTNADDWNRDETGARRFWPVRCGTLDLAWIQQHREQLFAEALVRYQRGESWWDVPIEDAQREQDARRQVDPWEDAARKWLFGHAQVKATELLRDGLGVTVDRQGMADYKRVAKVLRAVGWVQCTWREGSEVVRGWRRNRDVTADEQFVTGFETPLSY